MDAEWRWLIGIAVTCTLGVASLVIGGFWKVVAMVRDLEQASEANDQMLHGRINSLREETVKKVELQHHLDRLYAQMSQMGDEQREANKHMTERLDRLIEVATRTPSS